MHHTTSPTTRRAFLHRGLLLSLAALSPLRTRLVEEAAAEKKTKKQIKQRVALYEESCEKGGGETEPTVRPGGTTVTCTGSASGDWSCTVSSKAERCYESLTTSPELPAHPLQPDRPTADPGELPEQPLDPVAPPLATPGDVAEVPLEPADGGGVTITAYSGAESRGRHHRRRHGKGRKG
jgi:hypothetical protein